MFSTSPGHRFVLAKQIKQALSLPGKVTETQDCTSHQSSEPDVQEVLFHPQDIVLMKTQLIRHSSYEIQMFNIILQRD